MNFVVFQLSQIAKSCSKVSTISTRIPAFLALCSKLSSFLAKSERRIAHISRPKTKSNKDFVRDCKQKDMVIIPMQRRCKWLGHNIRPVHLKLNSLENK